MSRRTIIQRHHIRYEDHPLGEETVEVTMGEHRIISRMQMMSRFSPGFMRSLLELMPGMWNRLLVIGETKPKKWPGRLLRDSGHVRKVK
jgi:hypothetical protein